MCISVNMKAEKGMPWEVDEAVRQRTTKCQFNFKCLEEDSCPGCQVKSALSKGPVFVDLKYKNNNCAYVMPFGNSYICTCPTRYELYSKYNK